MTEPEKPRLRRFVISVRALMLLVVLVAVPVAWKVNRANTQRRAVAAIRLKGMFTPTSYTPGVDSGDGPKREETEGAADRVGRRLVNAHAVN